LQASACVSHTEIIPVRIYSDITAQLVLGRRKHRQHLHPPKTFCNILTRMFALRPRFLLQGIKLWQVLACLTLLSFTCRAVIPVGYMPDASGAGKGKFAITLCVTGGGTSTIFMDLSGDPDTSPAPGDHFNNQDCTFGIVMAKALMPAQEAPTLVSVITHRPAPSVHRNHAYPPLPALGPPLGSRAPPANLG